VYAASKQQYTAAGGEVKVPWDVAMIFTNYRRRNREIDTRIGEANAILRQLYRSVVTQRSLQTPQSFQFLNRYLLGSSYMVMNVMNLW